MEINSRETINKILEECRKIRQTIYPDGLPTGNAVITSGGNLPARYVIHTVGPIYGSESGKEAQLLANAYTNSLKLTVEKHLKTIACPSISTGVYSYPKAAAARVSSTAISEFLADDSSIEQVRLVFFKQADAEIFVANCKF